jgi:hypothetical protein
MPIKPGLVELTYLVFFVPSALKDVAACRMVNYDHVLWVEREHLVVVGIRRHMSQVDALPRKQLVYLAFEMKGTAAGAPDVAPATAYVLQPRAHSSQYDHVFAPFALLFLSASHFREPVVAVHCLDVVEVCKCDSTADSLTSSLSSLSAASSILLASSGPITPSQSDCSFVADEKAQVRPDCVCKSGNTACKSKLAQRECGFVSYKGVIVVLFSTCPIGPTAFSPAMSARMQRLRGCALRCHGGLASP